MQQYTTSTEFEEWKEYLWAEATRPTKEEYYLAQIACEIRRTRVKNPNRVKLHQFIIPMGKRVRKPDPVTAEEKRQHIARSKSVWKMTADLWKEEMKQGKKAKR